jgi:hypothetical protein
VRSVGEALKDAQVVLLAVPGQAVPDVVTEQGTALAGKVVIEAVNRMGAPEPGSRALIAAAAPSARAGLCRRRHRDGNRRRTAATVVRTRQAKRRQSQGRAAMVR